MLLDYAFIVLIALAIISAFVAVQTNSVHFMIITVVFASMAFLSLVALTVEQQKTADTYNTHCLDAGYVEALEKEGAWYCVTYGYEPRIERVTEEVQ